MKTKTSLQAALLAGSIFISSSIASQAAVIFTFNEVGSDVIATVSGDFVVPDIDAYSAGDNLAGDATRLLSESLFADIPNRFRHVNFSGAATATTLQLVPDKVWGGVSDIGFDGSVVAFGWVGGSPGEQVYFGGETVNVDGGTFTWTGATLDDVFSDGGNSLKGGGRAYDFENIGAVSTNYIDFVVVPEPSSTALLGLGALALAFRRKR